MIHVGLIFYIDIDVWDFFQLLMFMFARNNICNNYLELFRLKMRYNKFNMHSEFLAPAILLNKLLRKPPPHYSRENMINAIVKSQWINPFHATFFFEIHCVKSVQIWSFLWSVFSCIQSEYRKMRTRKNSEFGHFSRSDHQKNFKFLITSGGMKQINRNFQLQSKQQKV